MEKTLLQHNTEETGQQSIRVIVDRTPKYYPEVASEGVEYSWAQCKLFWRGVPVQLRRGYAQFIKNLALRFQNTFLIWLENSYRSLLTSLLRGYRPYALLLGTFMLLIFSFVLMGIFPPKVEFFPENQPNQIITYIEYPEGTAIGKTNKIKEIIRLRHIFIKNDETNEEIMKI